jgi:DNA-binding NtrC family response regulator/tetratricopeptide (TPR) repeat protein
MHATEIGALQVQAAAALGRHAEALAVVGRTRQGRRRFALEAAEALLGLMRPREALDLASRALRSGGYEGDTAAALRIARAQALWQIGAQRRAGGEAARAAEEARLGPTRAKACVMLARFAWKEQRLEDAARLAQEARVLCDESRQADGLARALEIEAGLLRDAGRYDQALVLLARRVQAATGTTRVDEMAGAHADLGDLLAFLGRWDAAAPELDRAIDLYQRLDDDREHTVARPRRAMVDLARGDVQAVRRALERARECAFDAPSLRGEHHLLAADLALATGDAVLSERESREALQAFAGARSPDGVCRAHVRRAVALVSLGRCDEGRAAAVRARREAPAARRDLRFLALLAQGRAELRLAGRDASAAFDAALAQGEERSGPRAAARLGRWLSGGAAATHEGVLECLRELEAWGDRRLLSLALADVRGRTEDLSAAPAPPPPVPAVEACDRTSTLAAAAEALLSGDAWPSRFAAALLPLRERLAFCRAAWIGPGALELRADGGVGRPGSEDLAHRLVARADRPATVDLHAAGLAQHPVRVLHDLRQALVVPAGRGCGLYADFRSDAPAEALDHLRPLARLLAAAADAGSEPSEEPGEACAGLLGDCDGMRLVRQTIARIGRSSLAVLMYGETGTGKERAAEALHRVSGRTGKLVCVNAAQLEDGLFESTLFGHVKGAFTGAATDTEGLVAAAHGGTLFLDEVADLSARGQAKLLRFLETGEYTRVGEPRLRRADVRLVSAANVKLLDRVREQRFREDLVYRLAGFTLSLPPLRERGDDVLLLARHFLRLSAQAERLPCPRLGGAASRALLFHAWPGNVRELAKQMHRAVVLAPGGVVQPEHLQLHGQEGARTQPTLRDARAAFERELVGRALTAHAGCRVRTAEALGITRQALALKLRRYAL